MRCSSGPAPPATPAPCKGPHPAGTKLPRRFNLWAFRKIDLVRIVVFLKEILKENKNKNRRGREFTYFFWEKKTQIENFFFQQEIDVFDMKNGRFVSPMCSSCFYFHDNTWKIQHMLIASWDTCDILNLSEWRASNKIIREYWLLCFDGNRILTIRPVGPLWYGALHSLALKINQWCNIHCWLFFVYKFKKIS